METSRWDTNRYGNKVYLSEADVMSYCWFQLYKAIPCTGCARGPRRPDLGGEAGKADHQCHRAPPETAKVSLELAKPMDGGGTPSGLRRFDG
eukprot:scaffold142764_cov22-Prasinocladus_malaysianus.AAC.1